MNYLQYEKLINDSEILTQSKKISLITSINKLQKNQLPVILTKMHLSNLIGIKYNVLKEILDDTASEYDTFYISKKSGGKRHIIAPSANLKIIQNYIKSNILDEIPIHSCAHGFVKNKSIYTNANNHLNKDMILNIDLKDFFPSIHYHRVFHIFFNVCGYSYHISKVLTDLCTYKYVLAQGACTSPVLSNLICFKMDKRLNALCINKGITYTRYADDMSFSGNSKVIKNNFYKVICNIIHDCGFEINDKKTRFCKKTNRQEVTGLLVNNGKIAIQRTYIKEIRKELYYLKKFGVDNHLKKTGFKNHYYYEHLKGKILFVKLIHPEKGIEFLREFEEIDWDQGEII